MARKKSQKSIKEIENKVNLTISNDAEDKAQDLEKELINQTNDKPVKKESKKTNDTKPKKVRYLDFVSKLRGLNFKL